MFQFVVGFSITAVQNAFVVTRSPQYRITVRIVFKNTLRIQLEKIYPSRDLTRWFDPLHMDMDENEKVLRIFFPHAYFERWFMGNMKQEFEIQARSLFENVDIIYYSTESRSGHNNGPALLSKTRAYAEQSSSSFVSQKKTPPPAPVATKTENSLADGKQPEKDSLLQMEDQSFDNFLVNRKNELVLASAKESVSHDTSQYTPFVLYGQSGTGKSHILNAMALALKQRDKHFLFGSIDLFGPHKLFSSSLADISKQSLFIDDAQRITSYPDMQDALVSLIDSFRAAGQLLALSFDIHPARCSGLNQKLLSRLNSGLVLELKKPDLDIRSQYADRQNRLHGLELNKHKILSIAQRYTDLRGIDGFLMQLRFFRSMRQKRTYGDHDAYFPDPAEMLERDDARKLLTHNHIINTVARHFSLSPDDITGKSRDKKVVLARHIAVMLCRELLRLSLPQVGRLFGNRDHTSVLHSIKRIKQLQESDKDMNNKVETVRKLCLSRE